MVETVVEQIKQALSSTTIANAIKSAEDAGSVPLNCWRAFAVIAGLNELVKELDAAIVDENESYRKQRLDNLLKQIDVETVNEAEEKLISIVDDTIMQEGIEYAFCWIEDLVSLKYLTGATKLSEPAEKHIELLYS